MKGDVLVVGAGVSGLTCAVCLLEAGYGVQVMAAEFATDKPRARSSHDPPPMCSPFAAAMWYPFAVKPLDRAVEWAKRSLEQYLEIERRPSSGVSRVWFNLFFGENPDAAVESLMDGCDPKSIPVPSAQYVAGKRIRVPFIETMVFLAYLEGRVRELGGSLERRRFDSLDECGRLALVVVNCTGLGAAQICNDVTVEPIRGQVLRVAAPAVTEYSLALPVSEHPVYVIPRSGDCVLGGTEEHGKGDVQPDEKMLSEIQERCRCLEPMLKKGYEVLQERSGLRPGRKAGVRLEAETFDTYTVIHNYGHGGAGFTVAWGCADEVTRLVDQRFGSTPASVTTSP